MVNIPFSPPDITEAEINEVCEALRSGWITTGPRTKEFERRLAEYCGTAKVACLNSATAALELNLLVLGIGTLLMTLVANCSLPAAAFEFASALGTVGLSNGLTSVDAPALQLLLEMFAMVLGRLEILMVFVGIIDGIRAVRPHPTR
jgi:Trk-type K+ transport system membrane component